jgi:NaMN:DMB phosphoribosyltransferase
MLLSAGDRRRWLGLIAPAIAVGMWIGTNDGHGVVLVAGFVVSLAVVALYRLTGAASAHRRTRSRRATGTGRMTRCDEDLLDSVR